MENQGKAESYVKILRAAEFGATCVILFFLAVIETTWVEALRLFGAIPLLPLAFCVCLSLKREPVFAVTAGAVCGLFLDLAKGTPVGFDCLLYTYISAGCVWLRSRFYFRKMGEVMLCVFAWVLVYGLAASFLQRLLHSQGSLEFMLKNAVYSAAAVPLFYVILYRKEG